MGIVAGIVGQVYQICHTVITYTLVSDTGECQFCNVSIDESTGFIINEFFFAFEGMFEWLWLFYMLVLIK
jgi:hypothetical protein